MRISAQIVNGEKVHELLATIVAHDGSVWHASKTELDLPRSRTLAISPLSAYWTWEEVWVDGPFTRSRPYPISTIGMDDYRNYPWTLTFNVIDAKEACKRGSSQDTPTQEAETIAPATDANVTETPAVSQHPHVVLLVDSNLRENAGTQYNTVGGGRAGTQWDIVLTKVGGYCNTELDSEDYIWYRVDTSKRWGWIRGDLVDVHHCPVES